MFQYHGYFSTKGQKTGVREMQVKVLEIAKIVLILHVEIISEEPMNFQLIISKDILSKPDLAEKKTGTQISMNFNYPDSTPPTNEASDPFSEPHSTKLCLWPVR